MTFGLDGAMPKYDPVSESGVHSLVDKDRFDPFKIFVSGWSRKHIYEFEIVEMAENIAGVPSIFTISCRNGAAILGFRDIKSINDTV